MIILVGKQRSVMFGSTSYYALCESTSDVVDSLMSGVWVGIPRIFKIEKELSADLTIHDLILDEVKDSV